MTGWHLDDDTLRRYVERADSLAEGASAEQHLLSCEPCRARVGAAASVTGLSVIDFAAVWDRTRDAVEVPRPSVFERLLRGAGLPAPEARLVAVASAFRGVWLAGVAAVLVFAALAAAFGHARGVWLFLSVAPVVPCLVVAAGYDPWMDPALEPELVTPYPVLRLILLRTIAVLALAVARRAAVRAGRARGDSVRLAAASRRLRRGGPGRVDLGQPAALGHRGQLGLARGWSGCWRRGPARRTRCSRAGPRRASWRWPRLRSRSSWCAGVGCASFGRGGSDGDRFDQPARRRAHVRRHPGAGRRRPGPEARRDRAARPQRRRQDHAAAPAGHRAAAHPGTGARAGPGPGGAGRAHRHPPPARLPAARGRLPARLHRLRVRGLHRAAQGAVPAGGAARGSAPRARPGGAVRPRRQADPGHVRRPAPARLAGPGAARLAAGADPGRADHRRRPGAAGGRCGPCSRSSRAPRSWCCPPTRPRTSRPCASA